MLLCIGLFGTCGGSRWREPFIKKYEELGIDFFNPVVEDWDPSYAAIEARHLASDAIILFPVTSETYGLGSLMETGFSIIQAMKLDDRRHIVVYLPQKLDECDPKGVPLDDTRNPDGSKKSESQMKASLRGRALVKQHLLKQGLSNVYIVESMEEMLRVSLILWESTKTVWPLRELNPHRRVQAEKAV